MKLFYFFFIILIIPFALLSQSNIQGTYKFRNYSIAQGLPSSETYDIEQDNEGNIWFATDRGVVKYNSRSFKTYTKKDGLIDDVVLQIYKDPFGKLWFLTIENRLCYYDNGKIYPYKYNDKILKLIPSFKCHSDKDIVIKKNKTIYLSIRPKGLLKIKSNGEISRMYNKNENVITVNIIENRSIWSLSVTSKSKNYDKIKIEYIPPKRNPLFLYNQNYGNYKVTSTNNRDNCYLMMFNSLYNLNQKKKILEFPNKIVIQSKLIDSKLWVSILKNGVNCYKKINNNYVLNKNILNNYSVTDIFKDANNGYWFSTLEKGIFYLPYIAIENINEKHSLILNEIKSIFGYNESIYIGFNGNNYQIIKNNSWINHKKDGIAYTQFCSSGKNLIISNQDGNLVKSKSFTNYWVKDLYNMNSYCLTVGKEVLKVFPNGKTEKLSKYYGYRTDLHAIMQDQNGEILIGGIKGLYKILNKKIIPYLQNKFQYRVTDLAYSKKWGKLIATRDGGVFIFNNNKFKKIEGLLSNDISHLFIDINDNLWVSSNKGVNILTKLKSNKIRINCITIKHGLPSNEISAIYVDKNHAWIGTKKGLSKININQYKVNNLDSKIKLISIELDNNKQINLSDNISIPHYVDFVKIKFGALNYLTKGIYKYRFHKKSKWTFIKNPEILLFNPSEGDYELEVSFLNENNKWSSIQNIANFEIEAPFWKTIYFKFIIGILISYFIFLFFQFKKKQFETKQKLLILEQKALFAQMNPHFIFNTLNSIQSFLIYNENEKAEYFLSKFSKLLRETLHISRNSSISLKKEFDILEKYLELEQMRFSNKFQWKIVYNMSIEDLKLRIPNMLIQPYIENSIKHGFTEKRSDFIINITITLIDDYSLKCEVIDNGIGRSASILKKSDDINSKEHTSYGEKITKERLKTYNKSKTSNFGAQIFDIELNGESKGTKVEIIIPILKNDKNRYS